MRSIRFVDRLLTWISRPIRQACGFALGSLLFIAIAINVSNVLGRYVFGVSLGWAEEVLTYILIWAVFVGGVVVTLENDHLRVDLLTQYVPELYRRLLELLRLVGLVLCCIYVALQSEQVITLFSRTGQRSTAAELPMVWVHGAIFLGFTMMAVAGGIRLTRVLLDAAHVTLGGKPMLRDQREA